MKSEESTRLRIKKDKTNVHANHRSRIKQKFADLGFKAFNEHEMLELLLFYSIPQADTNPTAHYLIDKFKNIKGVFDAPIERLLSVDGIGEHSAILIKLIPALMSAYGKNITQETQTINDQDVAKEFAQNLFAGADKELFYVICLTPKNEVIEVKELSSGSTSRVNVRIREVTEFCLKTNCDRIIISHNHPKSDSRPSNEDITTTHKLLSSCLLNEIDILDHIITAPNEAFSLAEKGLMQQLKEDVLVMLKYNLAPNKFELFSTSTQKYLIKK